MNIDSYIEAVWVELRKLEQLVLAVNDIMESRVDANLKMVSRILLVSLPEEGETVDLYDFIDIQERHVRTTTTFLVAKSTEIEASVDDLLGKIVGFPIDSHVRGVSESEIIKVKAHYNWSMYQALLNATRRSLTAIKMRLAVKRGATAGATATKSEDKGEGEEGKEGSGGAKVSTNPLAPPFFDVDLQLDGVGVKLAPSIEDIQVPLNIYPAIDGRVRQIPGGCVSAPRPSNLTGTSCMLIVSTATHPQTYRQHTALGPGRTQHDAHGMIMSPHSYTGPSVRQIQSGWV